MPYTTPTPNTWHMHIKPSAQLHTCMRTHMHTHTVYIHSLHTCIVSTKRLSSLKFYGKSLSYSVPEYFFPIRNMPKWRPSKLKIEPWKSIEHISSFHSPFASIFLCMNFELSVFFLLFSCCCFSYWIFSLFAGGISAISKQNFTIYKTFFSFFTSQYINSTALLNVTFFVLLSLVCYSIIHNIFLWVLLLLLLLLL